MSTAFGDFNRALIADLRAHSGKPSGGPFMGKDVLILTTKGARSGELRENPLVFSRDGVDLVILASKGGAPNHPGWYHNLVAHPDVMVEAEGERFEARARIAHGEEYERLYDAHAARSPLFNEYRKRTARRIPVIVLERKP